MSVRDNVAFGPSVAGKTTTEAGRIADRWLAKLDLAGYGDVSPDDLSGGQAQRVALARALALEPSLLVLDEPLAALDVETRTRLRRLLANHLDLYDGPRLLITHDPTDAFLLADEVIILEEGRITQQGMPAELRRRPATPYAAALAGLNLLSGRNSGGVLLLDNSTQKLSTADTQTDGAVLITIRPNAVALHSEQPHGSPRNTWATTVASVEPLGDITRVMLDGPLALSVDITPGAASSMQLAPGSAVWASVKATEVHLNASE